jgi:magnesium transporter
MTSSPEAELEEPLSSADLKEAWSLLVPADRLESFRALDRPEAEDFFLGLSARDQAELLVAFAAAERRSWIRLLAPDDAADLIQEVPGEIREELMGLLDDPTRA